MKDNPPLFFKIWGVILVLNQVLLFRGCLSPYCLIAALPHTGIIAFFLVWLMTKAQNEEHATLKNSSNQVKEPSSENKKVVTETKNKPADDSDSLKKLDEIDEKLQGILNRATITEVKKKKPVATDPLKAKGDDYERFIGKKFEEKGDLVIYNGLINGYEDQGVDIITINKFTKTINLIQCKNWTKMRMTLEHVEDIYQKLDDYNFDCFGFSFVDINSYQSSFKENIPFTLMNTRNNLSSFTIRKTLYLASEKVVELEVGRYLTMMSPTIFKYKDMKIVMKAKSVS